MATAVAVAKQDEFESGLFRGFFRKGIFVATFRPGFYLIKKIQSRSPSRKSKKKKRREKVGKFPDYDHITVECGC